MYASLHAYLALSRTHNKLMKIGLAAIGYAMHSPGKISRHLFLRHLGFSLLVDACPVPVRTRPAEFPGELPRGRSQCSTCRRLQRVSSRLDTTGSRLLPGPGSGGRAGLTLDFGSCVCVCVFVCARALACVFDLHLANRTASDYTIHRRRY